MLSIMVGVLAIAFSAFKTVHTEVAPFGNKQLKAGMITNDYIVQPSLNNFVQNAGSPSNANCKSTATLSCSYDVTEDGKDNIPDNSSYTATQINTYVSNGWLQTHTGANPALYQP